MAYPLSKLIVIPIYKLWLRKVEGMENIPRDRPFIIAANHTSYYDALLLPSIIIPKLNKKIHPLVNSFYCKSFVTGFFLNLWEAIPVFVDKNNLSREKNKLAFRKAVNYLKNNELIMIFPEGMRSKDGKLKKAFNGVARISLEAKVPVLPVGIIGANKVLPIGKIFPRFKRCEVKIGKLVYFDKYYNKKNNKKILEHVTGNIMKEISKLIGQEYYY